MHSEEAVDALGSSIAIPAWALQTSSLFSIRYSLLCNYILLSGPGQLFLQSSMACGRTALYISYLTVLRTKQMFVAYTNTEILALFYMFIVIK